MRLELIEGKLSRSVPRGLGGSNPTWLLGAGRKGRKDLARSLPGFKALRSMFLAEDSPSFSAFKEAMCEAQISALQGSPTVSRGFVRQKQGICIFFILSR